MAGKVRENAEEWLARGEAGLEVLRNHELTDPDNLAAIGYCFGGSTVLQLAFSGAELKCVCSFHGALMVPTDEQVKQTKATIFVAHGSEDTFIPEDTASKFRQALDKGDADWFMTYYGNAKHSFTARDADKHNVPGLAYDNEADARSWEHMRQLFDTALGSDPNVPGT